MTFDVNQIAVIGIVYLMLLFAIANATKRGWIPAAITNHPYDSRRIFSRAE